MDSRNRTVTCSAAGRMGKTTTMESGSRMEAPEDRGGVDRDVTTADWKLAEVPVEIGTTSVRRHLTGAFALNVPNWPLSGGGDWHYGTGWFAPEQQKLTERAYTSEEWHGPVLNRLGRSGLRDARRGFRLLGHPAGNAKGRIWCATYERAVVETAWASLRRYGVDVTRIPPIDLHQLRRWLPYAHQWARLRWLAWRLRMDLDGSERKRWDEWRRSWRPWR